MPSSPNATLVAPAGTRFPAATASPVSWSARRRRSLQIAVAGIGDIAVGLLHLQKPCPIMATFIALSVVSTLPSVRFSGCRQCARRYRIAARSAYVVLVEHRARCFLGLVEQILNITRSRLKPVVLTLAMLLAMRSFQHPAPRGRFC